MFLYSYLQLLTIPAILTMIKKFASRQYSGVHRFLAMFKKVHSEPGSNRHKEELRTYRKFNSYCRDVYGKLFIKNFCYMYSR